MNLTTLPGYPDRGSGSAGTSYINTRKQQPLARFPGKREFANLLLSSLPRAVQDFISPQLRSVYVRRDDHIYRPDEPIGHIYFPETAVFSEYQMLDDGRTIEVALAGKESVIGSAAVFGPCPAVNWTQVCATGTALKIESELFRKAIGHDGAVRSIFNEQLNYYTRGISQKVICSAHHSVEERLCTWLLMFAERCSTSALRLTQEQLARVLGVYRPSVTGIALALKTRGVIDYVRGKVTISDREKLAESACSCYREIAIDSKNFSSSVS